MSGTSLRDVERRAVDAVEAGWAIDALTSIVRIPSITGDEGAVQDRMAALLAEVGCRVERLEPDPADARADPEWPGAGAVVWDSTPHGPGRTRERVSAPGVVEVENDKLTGTQTVTFEPGEKDQVRLTVRLTYALREANALTPIVDRLFLRRALRDSLNRTLQRYAAERRGDAAGY